MINDRTTVYQSGELGFDLFYAMEEDGISIRNGGGYDHFRLDLSEAIKLRGVLNVWIKDRMRADV